MKHKDNILTGAAVLILFITAMINWTLYSWLILVAVTLILMAWYFRKA